MEKRTLLAIALSVMVFLGWTMAQYYLFPPKEQPAAPARQTQEVQEAEQKSPVQDLTVSAGPPAAEEETAGENSAEDGVFQPALPLTEEKITIETNLIRAVLTNAGGDVVLYQVKARKDKDEYVDMVLPGSVEPHAFTLAFGGIDAEPEKSLFTVNRISPQTVEFTQDFFVKGGGKFTLTKRYDFRPDEYMFEMTVFLNGAALNSGGIAYTLGFGPQIGPRFTKLDNRYEYRHYYSFENNKRRQVKADTLIDRRWTWAGIAGKYFAALVVPDSTGTLYQLEFSEKAEDGLPGASRMYIIRPAGQSGPAGDVYRFYLGPKNQENLGKYDTGNNGFKMRDLQLIKAANTSGFLSPLENLLKLGLQLFYNLIPNYGVAIILLTLVVKMLLFPLTKKSSESALKMQILAPKMKELQDKYRDNPAKLNAELSALYKKEGHNPMAGCLPLLIQLPLLWAMYNLFNTHFDLRGEMFIPGWIPDLSLPETFLTFDWTVPVLGWNSLRLLPFIYLASQLLYGFVNKTPDQQGNPSMAMMMYVMPIMFFFILYDVPSGLLVFWIFSNVFTLVQQLALNKYLAKKRAETAKYNDPPPVIAPRRRKR